MVKTSWSCYLCTKFECIKSKGKPLLLQIGVVIGWEQSSYTVGEGDGQLQVCVTLTGYLEAVLQQSSIRAAEGTAIRGKGKI